MAYLAWSAVALLVAELFLWGADSYLLASSFAVGHFLLTGMALRWLRSSRAFWHALRPLLLCMAGMLAWRGIGGLWRAGFGHAAVSFDASAFEAKFVMEAGYDACFLLGAMLGARREGMRQSSAALCAMGLMWQIAALAAYHLGGFGDWGALERGGAVRFVATIGNANVSGIAFCMVSLVALGHLSCPSRPQERMLWRRAMVLGLAAMACLVGFYGIILTQSRLAVVLFLLCLLLHLLLVLDGRGLPRRLLLLALMVLATSVALVMATLPANQGIRAGLLDKFHDAPENLSNSLRNAAHYLGLSLDRPLIGYGPGAFGDVNLAHLSDAMAYTAWDFKAPHSILLSNALELGWPHVIMELLALALCGALVLRARSGAFWTPRTGAVALALICAASGGLVDIALDMPAIAALSCWLLGLLVGRAVRNTGEPSDRSPYRGA